MEPQWEAIFRRHEQSQFRVEKSHYVATQEILSELQKQPKWVFVIELLNFEHIKQSKFLTKLNTFPEVEKQIQTWLNKKHRVHLETKPDLLEQFMQGRKRSTLHDLFMNIAFYGLENVCHTNHLISQSAKLKKLSRNPGT